MRWALSLIFAAALLTAAASPSDAKILIEIDKSAQQMVVSVDGVERHQWPVSTGRLGHDTPEGSYRAFRMERDHFSKEWDDAPMPHSIFFTKRGHAIHGSFDTKRIGMPASAGCVRLAPENAERLFALVEERGVLNTTVVITGDVHVALERQGDSVARSTTRRNRGEPARRAARESVDGYTMRMRQRYEAERGTGYSYMEPRYPARRYEEPTSYYYYYDQLGRPYRAPRYRPYYGGWQ
jgi:hypothetical protein